MKNVLSTLLLFLSFEGMTQSADDLAGLWVIEEVKVGSETMTPNARWTRLKSDFTQESGNGWFQHSFGTWSFNEITKELKILTENGLDDRYGSFKVRLSVSGMIWERMEDGMKVIVTLAKGDRLPATYRDELLGLWQLEEAKNDGFFYSEIVDSADYLFIRWDGKFVVGSEGNKTYGVYNVHGHKSELELIPYGEEDRSFWSVKFLNEGFEMKLLNSAEETTRRFKRIRIFPAD